MTKKTKTKDVQFYKAPCPSIDQILRIKKLDGKQAVELFNKLTDFVKGLNPDNSITLYAQKLITELLEDPKVLDPFVTDDIAFSIVLKEIYECIVDLYIFYRIEYICGDINNRIKGSPSVEDSLQDILSVDELMQMTPKKKEKVSHPKTLKEINNLEAHLKKNVIGQDSAIETLVRRSKLISVGFEKRGSFFFIGRTGVGKTELAKQFGKKFYGNFAKINCSEFSNGHEVSKLIGAPPGYIGSNMKSFFAEKAEKGNRWVFLFDEIEKAHEKLYNLLLSLLDDGTITDSQGTVLDFTQSIFLFTSNQGISELKNNTLSFKQEENEEADKETLKRSLDKQFSPEFRNRIDEFIYFNDLTRENAKKIAKISLAEYPVVITDSLLDYVVDNCYSVEYGVRELKRFVKNNVALPIAESILDSSTPPSKGDKFSVSIKNNKIVVDGLAKDCWAP
jgi:ATP-dependent Clp protease ATP-binding subunit ClpA/arsenate reductase-like glutaredoxin family protein